MRAVLFAAALAGVTAGSPPALTPVEMCVIKTSGQVIPVSL